MYLYARTAITRKLDVTQETLGDDKSDGNKKSMQAKMAATFLAHHPTRETVILSLSLSLISLCIWMRTATPAFIVTNALCFVATCLVTIQAIRNPKKLRTFLVIYALLSLPCAIVNTLAFEDIIDDRWNSLTYLISTALMMTIRIYLVMDIGLRLQTRPGWFHGLAYTGIAFLIGSCICIVVQLGILGAHPTDQYPYRPVFITGVCLAIVSSACAYLFAFLPLIRSIRASAYGVSFQLLT